MIKLFSVVCLSVSLFSWELAAQEVSQDYIVVSFERNRKGFAQRTFYWIMSQEDIQDGVVHPLHLPFKSTPMLLSGKVDTSFLSSIHYPQGEDISLFSGGLMDDVNGFESKELASCFNDATTPVQSVINAVKHNKRVVQRFKKKWSERSLGVGVEDLSRHTEIIVVSVTPIKGSFIKGWKYCFDTEPPVADYALCPSSDVTYDPSFWGTKSATIVQYADFSMIPFWEFMPNYSSSDNLGREVFHISRTSF